MPAFSELGHTRRNDLLNIIPGEGLFQPLAQELDLSGALLAVGQELLDPLEDDRPPGPALDLAGDLLGFSVRKHRRR